MKAALVWNDDLLEYDFGYGHPMRSARCKMGVEELLKISELEVFPPRYAEENELLLVHTEEYVKSVKEGRAGDLDTPVSSSMYDPAKLSAGATLRAVELALKEDYDIAINLCGGWHHAFENKARGFCIFNDVALAARYAQSLGAEKVFILDWDEHHGDGTQRIFYDDDTVFTMSIHQHPSTQYPYVTGYESENNETNFNIPIMPGETEQDILKKILPQIPLKVRPFKPDFFIVQMGIDGHKEDPMSSIDLGDRFYEEIAKIFARCVKNHDSKVILLGGGGFNFPKTAVLWRKIVESFIENM